LALLAGASLLLEIGLVCGIELPSAFYLWTAPAWLAWYLFATASSRRVQVGEQALKAD